MLALWLSFCLDFRISLHHRGSDLLTAEAIIITIRATLFRHCYSFIKVLQGIHLKESLFPEKIDAKVFNYVTLPSDDFLCLWFVTTTRDIKCFKKCHSKSKTGWKEDVWTLVTYLDKVIKKIDLND
jgi:hypothetical protein